MTRLTLKRVNAVLAAAGAREELVQGNGYLYFSEGEAHCWPNCSVPVCRLNHLSLEQWVNEWRQLKGDYEALQAKRLGNS